jgi:hypothetical protein
MARHLVIAQYKGMYYTISISGNSQQQPQAVFFSYFIAFLLHITTTEKKNYSILQIDERKWLVLRNGSNEIPGERATFVPPAFKVANIISLEQSILVCSCGYKHRYGIPCRHLFAIESEYDLANFSCRWQVAYFYYAFHTDHMELTKTFQERELLDQQGIRMKTVQQAP